MLRFNLSLLLLCTLLLINCESQKMDTSIAPTIIESALEKEIRILTEDIQKGNYGETHSLLVMQKGILFGEAYFSPFDQDSLHYQYSVTKSVTSLLIGIAIDLGYIEGVHQKLLDFFPEYTSFKPIDERKADITLRDLLTMRAGFQWDEWTYNYLNERNDANKLIRSADMMQFMLDVPLANDPGSQFTYNSGVTMLLSGILQRATGKTAEAFAAETLFKDLGIQKWHWEQGNDGVTNTGWGLHLLPKDMIRIGQMVLQEGEWEGKQVVSKAWLDASLTTQGGRFGYHWWLNGAAGSFSANGWGGQYIFIVPTYDLVVVVTAGNFDNGMGNKGFLLLERILRAVREG